MEVAESLLKIGDLHLEEFLLDCEFLGLFLSGGGSTEREYSVSLAIVIFSSLPLMTFSKNAVMSFSSRMGFPYYSSLIFFSMKSLVSSRLLSFDLTRSARLLNGNCGICLAFSTSISRSRSYSTLARILEASLCYSSPLGPTKKDLSSLFSICILAFSSRSASWWYFKFLPCSCRLSLVSCKKAISSTRWSVMIFSRWVSLN